MKKKIFSKIFLLVALTGISASGFTLATVESEQKEVVPVKAEETAETASFRYVEPTWNPNTTMYANKLTYAISFKGATSGNNFKFDGSASGTDQAATLGNAITFNGESFASLGYVVSYLNGGAYLTIVLPNTAPTVEAGQPQPVIHIADNTVFQGHPIKEAYFRLGSDGVLSEVLETTYKFACNNVDHPGWLATAGIAEENANKVPTNGIMATVTFNKEANANLSQWGVSSNDYSLKDITNSEDLAKASLANYTFVNGTLIKEITGASIGTVGTFIYLFVPKAYIDVTAGYVEIEVKDGGTCGADSAAKPTYIAPFTIHFKGYVLDTGCWAKGKATASVNVSFSSIPWNCICYESTFKNHSKGFLITFNKGLATNTNYFNGAGKGGNFVSTQGSKVTLNGQPFANDTDAEIKYFNQGNLWISSANATTYVDGKLPILDLAAGVEIFDAILPRLTFAYDTTNKWRPITLANVEAVITALHMDETTEGQCLTLYAGAKTAFNACSDAEKLVFTTNYKDASARLAAWAAANGDVLNGTTLAAAGISIFGSVSNSGTIAVIVVSLFVLGSFCFLFTKKRKHN